jgi:hypothetical protein
VPRVCAFMYFCTSSAVYLRRRKGAGGGAGEGPKRCSSLRVGIICECVCQAYYFISGKIVLAHTFAPRSACWRSCQLSFAPSQSSARAKAVGMYVFVFSRIAFKGYSPACTRRTIYIVEVSNQMTDLRKRNLEIIFGN